MERLTESAGNRAREPRARVGFRRDGDQGICLYLYDKRKAMSIAARELREFFCGRGKVIKIQGRRDRRTEQKGAAAVTGHIYRYTMPYTQSHIHICVYTIHHTHSRTAAEEKKEQARLLFSGSGFSFPSAWRRRRSRCSGRPGRSRRRRRRSCSCCCARGS